MTTEDFARWNRREAPRPGDMVLTREAPMGNACMLPGDGAFALTQRLMLLRTDSRFIHSGYILHFLNSSHFRDQVLEKCRGLTTPHLRVQDAPAIMLPLPALTEQQSIADRLDRVRVEILEFQSMQSSTSAELDALLPAILDQAFRGDL